MEMEFVETKISKKKLLADLIYRRAITVTGAMLYNIVSDDVIFRECEKLVPINFDYVRCTRFKIFIDCMLHKFGGYSQVYPEQCEYLKRYATTTILAAFDDEDYFKKLTTNRKKYKDPEMLFDDFHSFLVNALGSIDLLYREDFGDVREDVPSLED